MIYKLVLKGYGSYFELVNLPVDVIIDMLNYEAFNNKYEKIYYKKLEEKNKNGKY